MFGIMTTERMRAILKNEFFDLDAKFLRFKDKSNRERIATMIKKLKLLPKIKNSQYKATLNLINEIKIALDDTNYQVKVNRCFCKINSVLFLEPEVEQNKVIEGAQNMLENINNRLVDVDREINMHEEALKINKVRRNLSQPAIKEHFSRLKTLYTRRDFLLKSHEQALRSERIGNTQDIIGENKNFAKEAVELNSKVDLEQMEQDATFIQVADEGGKEIEEKADSILNIVDTSPSDLDLDYQSYMDELAKMDLEDIEEKTDEDTTLSEDTMSELETRKDR